MQGNLQILLKLYLASYAFVAAFGIVQFISPILGGPALLVEQWWLPGRVPRVNGFSYEPSYFATYLIMGLVCLGSLRRSGMAEYRSRAWTFVYLLIFLALLICFSRMGVDLRPDRTFHRAFDPVVEDRETSRPCSRVSHIGLEDAGLGGRFIGRIFGRHREPSTGFSMIPKRLKFW